MKALIKLENYNGTAVVSSRVVAQDFGKRHSDVLRDIENLIDGVEGTQNCVDLFIESQYQHPQNKQWYKEYLLTRDGFSLLVMGFTGKEALQWKLQYIEAFNKMEEYLKNQVQQKLDSYMIDNPVERAKRWIEEEEQRQALALELKEAQPKVEYYDTVLQADKLITVTAIAKDLGMSARDLNNVLHRLGVQYKLGNSWHLYSLYQHLVPTHFDYQITAYGQSLRVTEQGRKWIIELLKEYNIIK